MSNEELVVLIQAGDKELIPELWEQVKRFCFKIAGRYQQQIAENAAVSMEDLRQECYFAMMDAVQAFKPEAGSFCNLLQLYVRNQCRGALGLRGRVKYEHYARYSLDAPLPNNPDLTLGDKLEDDTLPGMTDDLELEELQRDVREAVDRLPPGWAAIVRHFYYEDLTLQSIADIRGLSRQWTYKMKASAIKALRKDPALKDYEDMNYHRHKGVRGYLSSGSSVVEDIVLNREAILERKTQQLELHQKLREEMIAYAWGKPQPSRTDESSPA